MFLIFSIAIATFLYINQRRAKKELKSAIRQDGSKDISRKSPKRRE